MIMCITRIITILLYSPQALPLGLCLSNIRLIVLARCIICVCRVFIACYVCVFIDIVVCFTISCFVCVAPRISLHIWNILAYPYARDIPLKKFISQKET